MKEEDGPRIASCLSPERVHLGIQDMPHESILDMLLRGCPIRPVRALYAVREDCLKFHRRLPLAFDGGWAMLVPLSHQVRQVQEPILAAGVFSAGVVWGYQGIGVRLIVLVLPTDYQQFISILRRLARLLTVQAIDGLCTAATPEEFLRTFRTIERRFPWVNRNTTTSS